MDIAHWIGLVVIIGLLIGRRRDRRQAAEDAAVLRGKWDLARLGRDSWQGRP